MIPRVSRTHTHTLSVYVLCCHGMRSIVYDVYGIVQKSWAFDPLLMEGT